jgi:hypothetical protein
MQRRRCRQSPREHDRLDEMLQQCWLAAGLKQRGAA